MGSLLQTLFLERQRDQALLEEWIVSEESTEDAARVVVECCLREYWRMETESAIIFNKKSESKQPPLCSVPFSVTPNEQGEALQRKKQRPSTARVYNTSNTALQLKMRPTTAGAQRRAGNSAPRSGSYFAFAIPYPPPGPRETRSNVCMCQVDYCWREEEKRCFSISRSHCREQQPGEDTHCIRCGGFAQKRMAQNKKEDFLQTSLVSSAAAGFDSQTWKKSLEEMKKSVELALPGTARNLAVIKSRRDFWATVEKLRKEFESVDFALVQLDKKKNSSPFALAKLMCVSPARCIADPPRKKKAAAEEDIPNGNRRFLDPREDEINESFFTTSNSLSLEEIAATAAAATTAGVVVAEKKKVSVVSTATGPSSSLFSKNTGTAEENELRNWTPDTIAIDRLSPTSPATPLPRKGSMHNNNNNNSTSNNFNSNSRRNSSVNVESSSNLNSMKASNDLFATGIYEDINSNGTQTSGTTENLAVRLFRRRHSDMSSMQSRKLPNKAFSQSTANIASPGTSSLGDSSRKVPLLLQQQQILQPAETHHTFLGSVLSAVRKSMKAEHERVVAEAHARGNNLSQEEVAEIVNLKRIDFIEKAVAEAGDVKKRLVIKRFLTRVIRRRRAAKHAVKLAKMVSEAHMAVVKMSRIRAQRAMQVKITLLTRVQLFDDPVATARLKEFVAASHVQRVFRGHLMRTMVANYSQAILDIQKNYRRYSACKEASWLRAMKFIREQQQKESKWQKTRQSLNKTISKERDILSSFVEVEKKTQLLRASLEEERKSFDQKCIKWKVRIERELLQRPLPQEWIPQTSKIGGRSYFLNAVSGECQEENPNLKKARQIWETRVQKEKDIFLKKESLLKVELESVKLRERQLREALSELD